jgi:hypothetical protein
LIYATISEALNMENKRNTIVVHIGSSEKAQMNVGIRKAAEQIIPTIAKAFGMKTFPFSGFFGRRRIANTPLTMSGMSAKVKIRITYSIKTPF